MPSSLESKDEIKGLRLAQQQRNSKEINFTKKTGN
jgi:hypothetical protein